MKIINIDGPDGIGKTTLLESLMEHYKSIGKKVMYIHFPRYETPIGELIRASLLNRNGMDSTAMQMLYSADRINFTKFALPELEKLEFDILFVDRYTTSGMVYGFCDGVAIEDILNFERNVRKADLSLVLIAPIETILLRLSDRKFLDTYENKEFQEKVLTAYKKLHTWYPRIVYIDATEAKEVMVAATLDCISRLLV